MPQVQGPFIPQPDSSLGFEPGGYDFTDFAGDGMADAQVNFDGFDQTLLIIEALAAEPEDPLAGLGIEDLVLNIASVDLDEGSLGLPAIDNALSIGIGQYAIASSFAPAAAWADPPAPFVPPDAALQLTTPTVPVNGYYPPATGIVGVNSTTGSPSLDLGNTTRIGQVNFVVGDNFFIAANGKPGDEVTCQAIFNGQPLGLADFGACDSRGLFTLAGTMGPDQVGVWHEDWYIAGQLVISFNFLVTSG